MAARRKRILVYIPLLWPGDAARKAVALLEALVARAAETGDKLTLLATSVDLLGDPVGWPAESAILVRVLPPTKLEPHFLPDGSRDGFRQFADLANKHDVAFLPFVFGAIPADCQLRIPCPMVVGIPHLQFDAFDSGGRTDRHRRELIRIAGLAKHFVFPTETLRAAAVAQYQLPDANTSVLPARGSVVYRSPEFLRSLGLPERYLLATGWNRSGQVCEIVPDALARLGADLPLPFVGYAEALDRRPLASLRQMEFDQQARATLKDSGISWFDLNQRESGEMRAILAGATAVLGNGEQNTGPDWFTLSAVRTGIPVLQPRADGFAESEYTFDPNSPDSLAEAIRAAGRIGERPHSPQPVNLDGEWALDEVFNQVTADRYPIRYPVVRNPKPRDQRVAWLISHTTLRDAEVPILREMGYEVYTNKVLPTGEDYRSGSADFSWDDDSTLPTDVLEAMNAYNFYQSDLTPEMVHLLNAYFGTIFCATYGQLVRQLMKSFRGRVLIRAFGLEHPRSYGEYLSDYTEGWLWQSVWRSQHRFWVAACYEQIPPHEPPLLREHSVILPVAMPDRTFRFSDRWIGDDLRVFFVCPSIHTAAHYYGIIYRRFKAIYGDIPHLIGGGQPIPVLDPAVAGFATEEVFTEYLVRMRVCYYHSCEPRHLHYHPLEAIAIGMPVVYMRGGLMEFFDTGTQAGACETDDEARDKLQRLLAGDAELLNAILSNQKCILEAFTKEFNKREWRRLFHDGVMRESCIPNLPSLTPITAEPHFAPFALASNPTADVVVLNRRQFQFDRFPPEAPEPVIAEAEPNRPPTRNDKIRGLLPAPLVPPVRLVYRGLKRVKRVIFPPAVLQVPPTEIDAKPSEAVLELDQRYLVDPPPAPTARPPLPTLTALGHGLRELDTVLGSDRWHFYLQPVGTLNPNLKIESLGRRKLIIGFRHLSWETEDDLETLTEAGCHEAMLWCRLAKHAIFATEADRALAVRRYGIDAERTSVLPGLTLTGGVPTVAPPLKHSLKKYNLPDGYLLAYFSKSTNANTWHVFEAIRTLVRRGVKLPPVVLTQPRRDGESGRSSVRVEIDARKTLDSLGLLRNADIFLLPELREARRQSLEQRARISIVASRWGCDAVRDVTRAALARVPVVAAAIPTITDVYGKSGENILLFDPDDIIGLADAIHRTLELTDETNARVERACAHATKLNSPEMLAERERLFAAILARAD